MSENRICIGCYKEIPEDSFYCKTCLDRRKAPRTVKLSDTRTISPSYDFEGFTDPFTGKTLSNET